jgi:RhtB (resistance to homoserine/threonine) family protein
MNHLPEFFTIALIHLLAVMSPGPDFAMISRNSLIYSKKAGLFSALGLGAGILVHVTYSLLGIGLLISQSIVLFSIIKFIGAGYLIYIGFKSLRSKVSTEAINEQTSENNLSPVQAIRMGFITNVTNPKVTLFFLSLFTQVIRPETPLFWQILYGAEMAIMTFLWFSLVAVILSNPLIKQPFRKIQHHTERIFGIILIAFGIKLAVSQQ